MILKQKIFLILPMHFNASNPGAPWHKAILDPRTLVWTNLEVPLGNATYLILGGAILGPDKLGKGPL